MGSPWCSQRRTAGVGAAAAVAQRPDGALLRLRGSAFCGAARAGAEAGAAADGGRQQFERQGHQQCLDGDGFFGVLIAWNDWHVVVLFFTFWTLGWLVVLFL